MYVSNVYAYTIFLHAHAYYVTNLCLNTYANSLNVSCFHRFFLTVDR